MLNLGQGHHLTVLVQECRGAMADQHGNIRALNIQVEGYAVHDNTGATARPIQMDFFRNVCRNRTKAKNELIEENNNLVMGNNR
jgi:hypothetical protein